MRGVSTLFLARFLENTILLQYAPKGLPTLLPTAVGNHFGAVGNPLRFSELRFASGKNCLKDLESVLASLPSNTKMSFTPMVGKKSHQWKALFWL